MTLELSKNLVENRGDETWQEKSQKTYRYNWKIQNIKAKTYQYCCKIRHFVISASICTVVIAHMVSLVQRFVNMCI